MIEIKFSQFMSRKFKDKGEDHVLYVLKAEECILYIGISRSSIWDRWFSLPTSHMFQIGPDRWRSNSAVGTAVLNCYPGCRHWTMQLWTVEDCVRFLNIRGQLELKRARRDVFYTERLMIEKLRPALNLAGVDYPVDFSALPECIRRYLSEERAETDRLYREMFSD